MSPKDFTDNQLKQLSTTLQTAQDNNTLNQAAYDATNTTLGVKTKIFQQSTSDLALASANYQLATTAKQSLTDAKTVTQNASDSLTDQNKKILAALDAAKKMVDDTIAAAVQTKNIVDTLNIPQPNQTLPPLLLTNAQSSLDDAAAAVTAAIAAYQALIAILQPAMLTQQYVQTITDGVGAIDIDGIITTLGANQKTLASTVDNAQKDKEAVEAQLKTDQANVATTTELVTTNQAALAAATAAFGGK